MKQYVKVDGKVKIITTHEDFWDTCTTFNDCSICPYADEEHQCKVDLKNLKERYQEATNAD